MTLSAVLTTKKVADVISGGEAGVLMHGPTFMANPLACAVALASLQLLESQDMKARLTELEARIRELLEPAKEFDNVADVRVIGSIGVVEMKNSIDDIGEFQKECVRRGVWIRPFGRNVYIMPPYIINNEQLTLLVTQMLEIVRKLP